MQAAWAGGTWSHLQGAVSAAVCLMKPDIGVGYMIFITCGRYPKPKADGSGSTDMYISGWMLAPSIEHVNASQRRFSHVHELEKTENILEEVDYEIEFSLDNSQNDSEKALPRGGLGFFLGAVEEEVKDISGEIEICSSSFVEED